MSPNNTHFYAGNWNMVERCDFDFEDDGNRCFQSCCRAGLPFFFQELVSTPVGHTQNSCFDMGKFPKDVFGLMASLYHHNLVQGHPGLRNWQV